MKTIKVLPEKNWNAKTREGSIQDTIVKYVKAGHNTLDALVEQFAADKWTPPNKSKAYDEKPRNYISGYITALKAAGVVDVIGKDDPKPKAEAPAKAKAPAKKAAAK